jgi:hypothetical protein
VFALLAALASVPGRSAATGTPDRAGDQAWAADVCATVPRPWLQRMLNSYRPDWSGQVQYLPSYPNPVDGGLSHSGPWPHLQTVPLLLVGRGIAPGTYERDVGLVDIAPTTGRLVGFDFDAPDGEALHEAIAPSDGGPPPRLVVTMVWDAGGIDVLDRWPTDWPFLRRLISRGAWYPNATVGIANSNTPPGHATIGTGAYPATHGLIDEYVEIGGRMLQPGAGGPRLLLAPTFGDLYDLALDNRPIVGSVSTLASHTTMMSHGTLWNGGDRDIAVMRHGEPGQADEERVEWDLVGDMARYFAFPSYANRVSSIDGHARALDQTDGRLDGRWRTNSIGQLRAGFDTPARIGYQNELIEALIEREGFGADAIADLLFLNFKVIDNVGHAFGLDAPEMRDAIRAQDAGLRDTVAFLDATVGRDQWTLILTADHGAQIPAEITGGVPIDPSKMRRLVRDRFDADGDDVELFRHIRPLQAWVDPDELRDNGFTIDQIARFVASLTASQVARSDFALPPGRADELVYQTAFPSRLYPLLTCLEGLEPS